MWRILLRCIGMELGWIVAEYGRQPWTISEVLPTYLSVSSVGLGEILFSLRRFIGFVNILRRGAFFAFYTFLLWVELYLIQKYIRIGPSPLATGRYHDEPVKA